MIAPRRILPTDLRDFLKSSGWFGIDRGLADRLYVLENPAFPNRQLIYPMDATAPDYDESVLNVVHKIADIYGEQVSSILYSINCVREDILRIRIASNRNDSSLPLNFASAVVANTERLLKASACTVIRPRLHHPRLTLNEATQFVEKAKFGQTREGSFIIQVSCPIFAMDVQSALYFGESDQPFVRQVVLSFQSALNQLIFAIEADQMDQLVAKMRASQEPVISSNFCEALSGLQDEMSENSLDVSVKWSPMRSPPNGVNVSPVSIQSDYFPRIEEIRRELRATELHQEDTFIGTVERLDGEMGADGRRYGSVVLALLLRDEGETVMARTILTPDEYEIADAAHMTHGAYVKVTGRLLPGRQPRQLAEMKKFELLE